MIQRLIAEPFIQAMGWTLLHFLWQGAVVAAMLAVVLAALKNKRANLRYLASCAALAVMLALPVFTLWIISSPSSADQITITATAPPAPQIPRMTVSKDAADDALAISGTSATAPSSEWNLREMVSQLTPWMTSLWFAGVLLLSVRMLGGWLYTSRLKNQFTRPLTDEWRERFALLCREIRISRPVRILESALVQVPTVIGWLRPVVLVPASALTGLTPRQLEAIIAHELAHIRRYDYLVNLLQTAVEILLFYHPAVWWVSRQVRREREHCCDDLAVEVTGDAIAYARALTEIETLRSITPRLVMAADGGSLLTRIQRIVGSAPQPSERSASWIAGVIAFTIVFVLAAGTQAPLFSDNTAEPVSVETASDKTQAEKPTKTSANKSIDQTAAAESEADEESEAASMLPPDDEEPPTQTSGSGYIEEMAALGYTGLTVDEIISLKNHGVTPAFVRELKAAGYDKLSVRELIRLRSADTSPQTIKELKDAGLDQLPFDMLVRLQTHGVTASYIRELGELGFKNLSADHLVRAADHGVTPGFVRAIQSEGYKDLSIDEIIRARDHGVDSDFVREIREAGYDGLKMDQVIRIRDHGVDAEFIKEMQAAGFKGAPIDQLIRARDHGTDPEFISKIRALGYREISLDQFIRMRDHGVTPDYIESIRKAGYNNVPADQLIRMRDHGVDARFIERAKSNGFTNLSIDQLIRLRDAGVFD